MFKTVLDLGFWSLGIVWNLGFGIWNFLLVIRHCLEFRISDFEFLFVLVIRLISN
jgi:hypothetical protein